MVTLEACLAAYKAIGDEETAQALHSRYIDFRKIEAATFGECLDTNISRIFE